MEITRQPAGDGVRLTVRGRIDARWADHLDRELSEVIRGGVDRIELDLAGVEFLSSAGIRVLLKVYKQLKAIEGALLIVATSPQVRSVLGLAGLDRMLEAAVSEETSAARKAEARAESRGGVRFEIFSLGGGPLKVTTVGDPARIVAGAYKAESCRRQTFPRGTFGLGIGAFGDDFVESRHRFGEFLAAGGAAAVLPTDEADFPDYIVTHGGLVPEVNALYGVSVSGDFAALARFEPEGEHDTAPLSRLATYCLEKSGAEAAGVVMLAESAGLVGAALRDSPAEEQGFAGGLFAHPAVRDRLTFTSERAFTRSLVLVAGLVASRPAPSLAPFLRPLDAEEKLQGHFHAAAFTFRPLKKGRLDLDETVTTVFDHQHLEGVLHLLHDTREVTGGGESEFVRGACWFGPLAGGRE